MAEAGASRPSEARAGTQCREVHDLPPLDPGSSLAPLAWPGYALAL